MEIYWYIAGVMLSSGALGGLVNFFIADPQAERQLAWWQHIIVGVAAAFMVPLFLNMISGDLIDKIRGVGGQPGDLSKMFVLAGFCLVAAVSSRSFIKTLSERVLQEVRAAKRTAKHAEEQAASAKAAVAPLVEQDETVTSPATTVTADKEVAGELSPEERRVLAALSNSRLTLRTITGIAKECQLQHEQVAEAVNSLIAKGLAGQTTNEEGKLRWYATGEGRSVAAHG